MHATTELTTSMNAVVSERSVSGHGAGEPAAVCQSFVVNLEHGLHARPCAMLVQAVQRFHGTVEVEVNGEKASGKSILGLMSLAAGYGAKVTYTIIGEHAHQTMANVERVFTSDFGMKTANNR